MGLADFAVGFQFFLPMDEQHRVHVFVDANCIVMSMYPAKRVQVGIQVNLPIAPIVIGIEGGLALNVDATGAEGGDLGLG